VFINCVEACAVEYSPFFGIKGMFCRRCGCFLEMLESKFLLCIFSKFLSYVYMSVSFNSSIHELHSRGITNELLGEHHDEEAALLQYSLSAAMDRYAMQTLIPITYFIVQSCSMH
jgi:hypothetical protein